MLACAGRPLVPGRRDEAAWLVREAEALRPFQRLHQGAITGTVQADALAAVIEERPLTQPAAHRLLLAGDWHGNEYWALRVLNGKAPGLSTVIQLGDFGFWHGKHASAYLDRVSTTLSRNAQTLLWLDGNHEDFDLLEHYPLVPTGPAAGLRPIRPRLWHLPRGTRWTWNGPDGAPVSWLSVGGAASVDRAARTRGDDWWSQEELTDEQADAIIAGGPADVLICHDRPEAAAIALGDRPGEWWSRAKAWVDADKARSDVHAARLQRVVNGVQPAFVWHGHLHARTNVLLDDTPWSQPCRVQGLADDGSPAANVAVVGTDGREIR